MLFVKRSLGNTVLLHRQAVTEQKWTEHTDYTKPHWFIEIAAQKERIIASFAAYKKW